MENIGRVGTFGKLKKKIDPQCMSNDLSFSLRTLYILNMPCFPFACTSTSEAVMSALLRFFINKNHSLGQAPCTFRSDLSLSDLPELRHSLIQVTL